MTPSTHHAEELTTIPSTARRPPARGGDGGYALLVALLAIIGLTVLATGGFLISRTESQMSSNYRNAVDGFYLAEAGLSTYMGSIDGDPPVDDTVTYSFADGTADVWATELVDTGDGHRMWQITSRGIPAAPYEGLSRQVSTLVLLDPLFTDAPGGWVVADSLKKSGGSGNISGNDTTTTADCPEGGGADKPGIWAFAFDDAQYESFTSGSPDTISTDTLPGQINSDWARNPFDSIRTATGWEIDWQGVLDGTVTHHDYVVDWATDGKDGFPDLMADTTEWAVVKVDQAGGPTNTPPNQVTLDDTCCSGRGVLIVEQSVKFSGDFSWDGIIMAGGGFTSSGNNVIHGSLLIGLSTTLSGLTMDDIETTFGSGTKTMTYDPCSLGKAGRSAGKLKEIPNSWFESYSF